MKRHLLLIASLLSSGQLRCERETSEESLKGIVKKVPY